MGLSLFLTLVVMTGPVAIAHRGALTADHLHHYAGLIELEMEVAPLPKVKADSIEQVVKFDVEEGMLAVRSGLPSANDRVRVIVPGLSGVTRLTLLGPQDDPEIAGRNFEYLHRDLTNRSAGHVYTHVSAVAGLVNLSRDAETGTFLSSVQYTQDPPPLPGAMAAEEPVRLRMQITHFEDPERNLTAAVSAQSFVELRRQHPREVDTYLRPIIRSMGQEGRVFGAKPEVAWQVLGSRYTPDPKLIERLSTILARLDADDFRQREAAAAELKQLGVPASIALMKMDRSKLSLQQNSGIDEFLAEFAPLGEEDSRRLSGDVSFLLDVLYSEDAALRQLALDQLQRVLGRPIAFDLSAEPEARTQAIAKLRVELAPATQPATKPK